MKFSYILAGFLLMPAMPLNAAPFSRQTEAYWMENILNIVAAAICLPAVTDHISNQANAAKKIRNHLEARMKKGQKLHDMTFNERLDLCEPKLQNYLCAFARKHHNLE